jgi:hypothetical protein
LAGNGQIASMAPIGSSWRITRFARDHKPPSLPARVRRRSGRVGREPARQLQRPRESRRPAKGSPACPIRGPRTGSGLWTSSSSIRWKCTRGSACRNEQGTNRLRGPRSIRGRDVSSGPVDGCEGASRKSVSAEPCAAYATGGERVTSQDERGSRPRPVPTWPGARRPRLGGARASAMCAGSRVDQAAAIVASPAVGPSARAGASGGRPTPAAYPRKCEDRGSSE